MRPVRYQNEEWIHLQTVEEILDYKVALYKGGMPQERELLREEVFMKFEELSLSGGSILVKTLTPEYGDVNSYAVVSDDEY
jgi:hypothetical protein